MNKPKFFLAVSVCLIAFVVSCSKEDDNTPEGSANITVLERYKDMVFNEVDLASNVKYGSNLTQGGQIADLLMDIYQPHNDTALLRPLIVLAHGGGFASGSKAQVATYAANFAKAGFVVAAINYRLLDIAEPGTYNFKLAAIEAVFDMKAAVRFLKKSAQNGNPYLLDTTNFFIGGYSAGAITALHYGYLNTEMEVEQVGGADLSAYLNANGGIEGNSGNQGCSAKIKGIINISGALFSVDLINANEPILCSVHGTADEVVPYLAGESNETGIYTEGSGIIHPVLDDLEITNDLHTIDGGNHGAFLTCSDCQAFIRQFIFENL